MKTMISKNRQEIVLNLFFELDEICKKNNLNYTMTGVIANSLVEENQFPDSFDYLTVAMTQGDIDKFIRIINDGNNSHRQVEYFLNNPYASGFQIRYCNEDTTLINVKEIGKHVNYGMYIKIKPIEKVIEKKWKAKLLKFLKLTWRASKKDLDSCHYKRYIPVLITKCIVSIVGKKNFSKKLYNFNKKLRYIDNWDEIKQYEKVKIGKGVFYGERIHELNDINVSNHLISLSPEVLHRIIEVKPSHETVLMNDIEDVNISYKEFMTNNDILNKLDKTRKQRNQYLRIVTLSNKAAYVMKQAWRTYLMTRDVINCQDIYNSEKIDNIKKLIESNDYEAYFEEMQEYLIPRRRWKKLKIPFIKNQELEQIIELAKNKFDRVEFEDF